MWRVLQALVAWLDLGGMGPSVALALDPRRMTLARKDVSEYVGAVIPFYERWAHRHEFLMRGHRRGETVEEYFQAKRDLLMDGNDYGDIRLPGLLERFEAPGAGDTDGRAGPGTRLAGPDHGAGPPDGRVGCRHRP